MARRNDIREGESESERSFLKRKLVFFPPAEFKDRSVHTKHTAAKNLASDGNGI